jgi:hypothetical protein
LESKLRSCSSMASSSSPSDSSSSSGSAAAVDKVVQSNPSPSKASTTNGRASLQTSKKRVKTKLCFQSPPPAKEKNKVPNGVEEPPPPSLRLLSSPFNFDLLSPRPYVDRALHLQETLDNVQWNFSFEVKIIKNLQ